MDNNKEPWERQAEETGEAYQAFIIYRDFGIGNRSTAKVKQELGKSKTLLDRWCRAWEWVARCEAWDNRQQQTADELHAQRVKEAKDAEHALSTEVRNKVREALLVRDFTQMTAKELAIMWELARTGAWAALGLDSKQGAKGAGEIPIAKAYGEGVDIDAV